MKVFALALILMGLTQSVCAETEQPSVVGSRPGYTFEVEKERHESVTELVLIAPPPPEKTLKEKIFNEKLTKDLKEQYEYRFGTTEVEQSMNSPDVARDSAFYYRGDPTVTTTRYHDYQRSYGEYVGRKVIENQADLFFKNDPDLKAVYQAKDKISNIKVETKSGWKYKWNYNLAGSSGEIEAEKPGELSAKLQVQFSSFSYLTEEETVSITRPFAKVYSASALYKFYDGLAQVVVSRRLTQSLSSYISGATTVTDNGPSVRQTIGIIGISWAN